MTHHNGRPWAAGLRALVSAIALLLLPAAAHAEDDRTPCGELSLGFDSTGYDLFCYSGDFEDWDASMAGGISSSYEEIIADGRSSWITLATEEAGFNTFLFARDPREVVTGTSWFEQTRGWGDSFRLGKFRIALFEGKWGYSD